MRSPVIYCLKMMSRIQFVNLPTDKEQCNGCFSRTQMGKLEDPSSRPAPSAAKNPAVNIQAALAGCNQPQAQAAQPRPSHIVKWRILCSCLQPPGGQLKFPPQTHAGCFSRLQSSSKKQPGPSHIVKLMQCLRVKVFLVNTHPGFTHWPALLYTVRT